MTDICERCEGARWVEYSYDPSPPGVALAPGTMTDMEPCPKCNPRGEDWPSEPEEEA
jgi:hypothetical protein